MAHTMIRSVCYQQRLLQSHAHCSSVRGLSVAFEKQWKFPTHNALQRTHNSMHLISSHYIWISHQIKTCSSPRAIQWSSPTDILRPGLHKMAINFPDSKVHGANMGPIWGRQDLGGPQVGPMNFAILVIKFSHAMRDHYSKAHLMRTALTTKCREISRDIFGHFEWRHQSRALVRSPKGN